VPCVEFGGRLARDAVLRQAQEEPRCLRLEHSHERNSERRDSKSAHERNEHEQNGVFDGHDAPLVREATGTAPDHHGNSSVTPRASGPSHGITATLRRVDSDRPSAFVVSGQRK